MISLPRQPSAAALRSFDTKQLAFLDDPLVRFAGIFNPVLTIVAFGRQELRDLINAVRTATTEGARDKAHRLADFEFVLGQKSPPLCPHAWRATRRRNRQF
jgi:hypothetical protein